MTPTMTHTQTKSPCGCDGGGSPCGCHENHHSGCCSLICLERPNYFCGHLLTDEDLSLEVRYVVEKNKLRNRHLFGHGVVCGLKLFCDSTCAGYIRIGEGYAIDACGNDLVVCEPAQFNLIGALKAKKLLFSEPERDPCGKTQPAPECRVKQCFQIVACYEEEKTDYTSPFQAGCQTGPAACLPTRIKERVRFDVIEQSTEPPSYSAQLLKRIRACYAIFSDGTIGKYMKDHVDDLQTILEGHGELSADRNYCDIFCTLRAHFLHYLSEYPDCTNCSTYTDAKDLVCPDVQDQKYAIALRDAFCQLITLMQRYQYDCVLNQLVFPCPAPSNSDCVVLGTVEVMGSTILRLCHTPRKYVWSAANLEEVFYYELMTNAAFGRKKLAKNADEEVKETCCPTFEVDCLKFLDQFRTTEYARRYAAEEPILAMDAVRSAFHSGFNFTDTSAISPRILENLTPDTLKLAEERFKLNMSMSEEPVRSYAANAFQEILGHSLLYAEDPVIAHATGENRQQMKVRPDFIGLLSTDRTSSTGFDKQPDDTTKTTRDQVAKLQKQLKISTDTIASLQKRIDDIARHVKMPDKENPDRGGVK
jgi:hypothetical protein